MDFLAEPGDRDIRAKLWAQLTASLAHQPRAVVVEELGLCRGRVRVDLAAVNGDLHGYEIKSDRDSLRRLAAQVDVYGLVLDRATLVVGPRHLDQALALVPAWWQVLAVEPRRSGIGFSRRRPGRRNPGRDPRALAELLWSADATSLLASRGALRGLHGKPRRVLWDRVCELYTLDEIAAAVRERIKARAAGACSQPSS